MPATRRSGARSSRGVSQTLVQYPSRSTRSSSRATTWGDSTQHRVRYYESDADRLDEEDEEETYLAKRSSRKTNRAKRVRLDDYADSIKEDSRGGAVFKMFPTEIHQLIAEYLPDDSDIVSYARICNTSRKAMSDESVWHQRFQRKFDMVEGLDKFKLLKKYAFRQHLSRQWICFDLSQFGVGDQLGSPYRKMYERNQKHCLEMFRDLIHESNACKVFDKDGNRVIKGSNLQFILDKVQIGQAGYIDIIDSIFKTEDYWRPKDVVSAALSGTLLLVIQLCLTFVSLHPKYSNSSVSQFDLSQSQVYAIPFRQPVFSGAWKEHINVRWLLHTVNFFKYHLKAKGEGLLAHYYPDLDPDQYPQPWVGRVKPGTQPLGSHWKGAYTYMEAQELLSLRCWNGEPQIHSDSLDGRETFQDMTFSTDECKFSAPNWPQRWETILNSEPWKVSDQSQPQGKRSSPRGKAKEPKRPDVMHFWGSSHGGKNAHLFGRIHALPPQQDVYGFQRVVVMKFYTRKEAGQDVYDPLQVYGYEGCVLPGGRIIVGRWWDANADRNDPLNLASGPFIWWNVDRSAAATPIKEDEAWDFLDTVHDPNLMGSFSF